MPAFQKPPQAPGTLTDIRSIIQKLKKSNPELEQTPLRNISVEDCPEHPDEYLHHLPPEAQGKD